MLGMYILRIFIFLNNKVLLLSNLHKAWVKTRVLGNDVLLLPLPLGLDDPPGVRRLQPLHRCLHLPDEAPGQDDGWSTNHPSPRSRSPLRLLSIPARGRWLRNGL